MLASALPIITVSRHASRQSIHGSEHRRLPPSLQLNGPDIVDVVFSDWSNRIGIRHRPPSDSVSLCLCGLISNA
jgi:hypothetical protein